MADVQTKRTNASVTAFLAKATTGERHEDCRALVRIMERASGAKAAMWGPAIVGFGAHPIPYADGTVAEWPIIAFSPRKGAITIYGARGSPNHAKHVKALGKHKVGGGCLYLKRLADVDLSVLQTLLGEAVKARKQKRRS